MGPRPLGRGREFLRDPSLMALRASMGPRPLGRGRQPGRHTRRIRPAASMGPRPLGRGRPSTSRSQGPSPRRQWGRDLSAAEGGRPRPNPRVAAPASMGPRPLGRGRASWTAPSRPRPSRVNGAATSRPRKVCSIFISPYPNLLSVNGAATSRPRKASRPGRPSIRAHSVNGAATSRPRKVACLLFRGAAPFKASMGPRPLGRGRAIRMKRGGRSKRASMGPRPLGRGRRHAALHHALAPLRQWGRDLSAAEGRGNGDDHTSCTRVNGAATSRPRKAVRPWGWRGTSRSVNGAATSRPRKAATAPTACAAAHAPRQWGRDLSAAEGCCGAAGTAQEYLASMGPRPLGRGRRHAPLPKGAAPAASMGPRPLGRGRANAPTSTRCPTIASMGPRPLGRGREDGPECGTPSYRRVNGAATSRPRKA